MNVHALLAAATADVDTTVHPDTVQADVLRGRRALRRRRAQRTGAAGLVAAAAVAGALSLGGAAPGGSTPGPLPQAGGSDTALDAGAIQLVDYTGEQPAGFTVDAVPAGWTLLGSDEYALTIGPADVPDADPDSYLGKLTVLLLSQDAGTPAGGTAVQVGAVSGTVMADGGGAPGSANAYGIDPDELTLFFTDPVSGQPVTVQVPAELHWSAQQVADFAAGVHVTEAAQRAFG